MKKIILLAAGFLALGLGAVGMLLPVLPTTPFVLVAAGCFGVSSPRLAAKLENTRYFGEYIRNYRSKTGITPAARRTGLVFLWATLILSAALFRSPHLLIVLGVVGIAVTVHILMIRRVAVPAEKGSPKTLDGPKAAKNSQKIAE